MPSQLRWSAAVACKAARALIPGVMLGVLFLQIVVDAVAKIVKSGSGRLEGVDRRVSRRPRGRIQ